MRRYPFFIAPAVSLCILSGVYAPTAGADTTPVQLVCDNLGSIVLDYANGKVTFSDHTYPMNVTPKEITWQLHSDVAGRNYFYTLNRDTGQLMYRNDGDNTAGVDNCKPGGQKF